MSSLKQLFGEFEKIKYESDKHIHPTSNYVISVNASKDITQYIKEFLYKNTEHLPVAICTFGYSALLIYSCIRSTDFHYLKGSHQAIISEYVSILSRMTDGKVDCEIVEFNSRVKLTLFIIYNMLNKFTDLITNECGGKLKMEVGNYSIKELKTLYATHNLNWTKRTCGEKYGTLYKIKEKDNIPVITSFNKKPDFRKYDQFIQFIFDCVDDD